jgi:6-phosphogluconolactonase
MLPVAADSDKIAPVHCEVNTMNPACILIVMAGWLGLLSGCNVSAAQRPADLYRVYIGTYTAAGPEGSRGIYRFDLDATTGQATEPVLAAETVNPSFLAVHPSRRFLYAVGEVMQYEGQRTGSVAAFEIDPASGNLKKLNAQSSRGTGPCHLVVDPPGRHVLVANYGGGSVAALPIESDGRLGASTGFVQHEGPSRVNPQRQEAPHAHSINLGPDGSLAFAADLGADRIFIYAFDGRAGTLDPHDPPFASTPPGGGPRHFAFHPSGKFAYTNNELTSSVTAFEWRGGSLKPMQTISTLPHEHAGNTTAEIVVHPGGRFLYVSNRGHDSLAAFRIDERTGQLTALGHTPTGGRVPRNFAIEPGGRWLIAANQESGSIVIFRVDRGTGALEPTGQTLSIPRPVCVRFVPL